MLTDSLKKRLDNLWDDFYSTLNKLVAIPSISNDQAKDGTPFGKPVQKALETTLELAKSMGFKTYIDTDGYYGYAEIGEQKEMIGVIGHLDVVPPGDLDNWNTDPWKMVEKDGKIFGRGTQDDKGPTLAAMYATKALIDEGVKLNKRVRFVFGTDEEVLWRGIDKYVAKEEIPSMAFTPDSSFPLKYAEKGLLQFKVTGKGVDGIKFQTGGAFNVVPDNATWTGEKQAEIKTVLDSKGFQYEEKNGGISVLGKTAHAAKAWLGTNALSRLAIALVEVGIETPAIKFIASIGEDVYGTEVFGDIRDEPTGRLTMNIAYLEISKDKEEIKIDIRVPVTATDHTSVIKTLAKYSETLGLKSEKYDELRSLYMPLDHPLITTLMDVYARNTGDYDSKPMSSGGATFARAMDNCVAFGYVFPNTDATEHLPNEYIRKEEMQKAIHIYADAIMELAK